MTFLKVSISLKSNNFSLGYKNIIFVCTIFIVKCYNE